MTDVIVDETQVRIVEVERQGTTVVRVMIPGPQGPAGSVGNASDVPFTPSGNLSSTNVQDAIEELDAEKAAIDQANIESDPYLAVGNDSTVNTTAIQAALDSGKAWIYVPEGIFRSAQVTIPSTVKRIYGPGTLKATGSISNFFLVSGSGLADFTLECVVDVSPSTYPAVAALCFSGSVNSKAKGAFFKNSGRFALWQRDGCLNCGVEDSRIEGFAQCAFNEEDFSAVCTGTFVRNCKIKNTASCTGHIIDIKDSINPVIEDNKIDGNGSPQFGICMRDCINPNTHDNEVKNTLKEAIHYGSTTKGRIRDNDCDWPNNASTDFGISVAPDGPSAAAAADTEISDNYVRRAGKSGIAIAGGGNGCPGGSMTGNIVVDPNQLGGSNPTPTHSNGFELYDSGAEDWHVAGNLAISNDGNMTYGFSEVPTEAGADNNTFESNRSIGHATGEVNLSGTSSKWNQPTIRPDEAYGSSWNGKLEAPTKNAVYDKVETLQPLDADLTTIAGLSPSDDDFLQRKSGAWANRSVAQAKTDLNAAAATWQSFIYCRAATTGPITIATALNDGDTIDGVTLANGDFVLVKDQASAAENGVYGVFTTPFRAPHFPTYYHYAGAIISVVQGTVNAGTLWQNTNTLGGTLDATALDFARRAGPDIGVIEGLSPSNDDVLQRKSGAWANRTIAQLLTDLAAAGTTFQPLDSDLTTIAGLTATTDNFLQAKSSAWASRTPAQVKADLGLPTTSTDNRIVRHSGTAGAMESSAATVDDNGVVIAPKFYSQAAVNLADDGVAIFTPGGTLGYSVVHMLAQGGPNDSAIFWASIATGQALAMLVGSNVNLTTGVLTGTTGTDGKVNVSAHTDGKIYVENRVGAQRSFVLWLQGI